MENQVINDEYIVKLFFTQLGYINPNKTKLYYQNKLDNNIIEYLKNRYLDSESLNETLIRIQNKIEYKPKCPICGKLLMYSGNRRIPYYTYCSDICCNKDKNKIEKAYKTMIDNYGENNKFNRKKAVNTYNEKTIEEKQQIKDKRSKTLKNKTKEEKNNIHKKRQQTWFKKYGYKEIMQVPCINKKAIEEKIKKYGSPNNHAKYIETCLKKYGSKSHMSDKSIVMKIANSEIRKIHEIETKRRNHTFNTSKSENESYKLLRDKYPNVKYQYRSELYPFACDFFIPELDLYIECNYHWTHGDHPFNENNLEDQEKLKLWKSKNTKFYENAINCWTIRDVNKRNKAKENNLNYIEFWNISELKEWLKNN